MTFGGILTAMVTPFDANGELAEDATASLVRHLLENGCDGLVLAGSTGEGSTLSDEEKLRLWEIGVAESGEAPVIAGTGSNDTRHSVELTHRAAEVGVDGVLVVTPYYNKPDRRGLIAHFGAVAAASDLPVIVYNIPSRSVIDMPNDLLAELGEIDNVVAVKQSRYEDVQPIEGLDLLAGNDDALADMLDVGATGGICVASNVAGTEMRRMIDEPESRREVHDSLSDLFDALAQTPNPMGIKAALNMTGHDVGGLRLPLVEANEEEKAVVRASLERHRLLATA
ncbi:MAG: 4-hydroxy-tetrahydrodipicolinate synthase [Actinomycetota bacterium]|jgi:4-hydroxy-tetrahydrodipicolinate synthase|nr:4-hydroxy-tetrahydrodipicolinate synthase [Actinomycetota bacterium]